MQAEDLRAIQAPFKEQYRQNPEQALGVLKVTGTIEVDTLTCRIDRNGPPLSRTGMHPMTGGDGLTACAAEMMLESLIGCAGVTFAAVATSMEIPITNARINAAGTLDFRGTLGVSRETPVGFQNIELTFEINSTAPDQKLQKLIELAERYCVVAQTLKGVTANWIRSEN
ncbi:OsmC family protein [Planctomicrobium sp. SH668]|uniref:OsmC family protein n=1 Tax=Planctomicrobium sp. SH668 TaxID=3448126 RepID=UPI003F5C40CE